MKLGLGLGLLLLCAGAVACGRVPSLSRRAPLARARAWPGDALAFRFTDHAGDARLECASLSQAWKHLDYPAKLPSPYSGLVGESRFRVASLALADADVSSYGLPERAGRPLPEKRFDPIWNRTRAVYASKTALFAPAPCRYSFALPAVARGKLQFAMAIPPQTDDTEFAVEADGRALYRRVVTAAESGIWVEAAVDTKGAQEIALVTRGRSTAPAFWGDPLLFSVGAGAPGPNVLLIVVDTLRVDAVGVMPNLRALVKRGASFDQAITAATWTRPALLAILGGDLPTALGHGAEVMIPSAWDRQRFYALSPPLLPRLLQSHGYRARAIGNNFFLLGYPQIGLDLGFEEVDDVRHPVLDTPATARAAAAFMTAHAREAWFLHLHFDAPHWPYTPPPEYLARVQVPAGFPSDSLARAYLAEAAYADDYLGRVLAELDRLHLSERTLVIVAADHGEIFDHAHAHRVEALGQPTLHHHGWAAYDELIHVPLVVVLPGSVPARSIVEQVSLIDVAPTVMALLGLPPLESRGRSLALLWNRRKEKERPAFVEGQNVRALRSEGWAYLRRTDGRLRRADQRVVHVPEELYDLRADPLEHHNLVAQAPERLARMRTLFEQNTPVAKEPRLPLVHLRVAPAPVPQLVEGVVRTSGSVSVQRLAGGEVWPVDAHAVGVRLHENAALDLAVDPPTASLQLALRRDGRIVDAGQVLLGGLGLPLLAGEHGIVLDRDKLAWVDAARPPVLGQRGDILLWRDQLAAAPMALPENVEGDDEVAHMMRRWGYAQPGGQ